MIRPIKTEDIERCLTIYNYYIANSTATLELEELCLDEFKARVDRIAGDYPYLVYEQDGHIMGYAYIHEFSPRGGYRYTCENTVYVDPEIRGKGVGKALMEAILSEAAAMGLRDVISVVTGENESSIAFHKALGFTDEAFLPGVAEKFGRRFGVHYLQYRIR